LAQAFEGLIPLHRNSPIHMASMAIFSIPARCFVGLAFMMLAPIFATQEHCTESQVAEGEEAAETQVDDLQLLQVGVQLNDFQSAEVSRVQPALGGHASKEQPDLATEYVALALSEQCEDIENCANNKLRWMKLTYPTEPFDSIENLTWSHADGDPALGMWDNMPMGATGFSCTMRLDGTDQHASKAYAFINDFRLGASGRDIAFTDDQNPGGCCAPVMRVYEKSTGEFSDIDLLAAVREAVDDQPVRWISASHAFHLDRIDGSLYAFLIVQYVVNQTQDNFGDVHLDAIVCLNMDDGKTIRRTETGLKYFSLFDNLGTFSDDDSVYKIRYVSNGTSHPEQWHLNGISRFTTKDGTAILAFSTIHDNEVILARDPWTYSAAERGGEILQRFGNPGYAFSTADGVAKRHFGYPASEGHMFSVHGAQYFIHSDGTEQMAIFNNGLLSADDVDPTFATFDSITSHEQSYESASWRFQVKLMPESQAGCGEKCGEEVFATSYHIQRLGKYSFAQGGCRPLGNHYGAIDVFMCNTLFFGPVFYDGHGRVKHTDEHYPMYDSIAHFEVK